MNFGGDFVRYCCCGSFPIPSCINIGGSNSARASSGSNLVQARAPNLGCIRLLHLSVLGHLLLLLLYIIDICKVVCWPITTHIHLLDVSFIWRFPAITAARNRRNSITRRFTAHPRFSDFQRFHSPPKPPSETWFWSCFFVGFMSEPSPRRPLDVHLRLQVRRRGRWGLSPPALLRIHFTQQPWADRQAAVVTKTKLKHTYKVKVEIP